MENKTNEKDKIKKELKEKFEKEEELTLGSKFIYLGIFVYIVLTSIDRFVIKVPDRIYVPMGIIGILLILIGFIENSTNKEEK